MAFASAIVWSGRTPVRTTAAIYQPDTPASVASPVAAPAAAASAAALPSSPAPAPVAQQPIPFGLRGEVRIADLPAGRFRDELAALPVGARERALAQLGRLQVPRLDVGSLRADRSGRLFYRCLAPSAPRLEAALVETEEEESVTAAALAAPAPQAAAVPISTPPVRHSRPGATKVVYLDFNGHDVTGTAWNEEDGAEATYNARPYDTDGDATTFSDQEQAVIVEIWARIAEDFAPFDVDVTTEQPATFTTQTGRIVYTKMTDANGKSMPDAAAAGGVGYLDVFGDSDYAHYSPVFVYYDKYYGDAGNMADAGSHEIGHNLGLTHDGVTGDEYYDGHYQYGTPSWGPLMGAPYYRTLTQWSKGDYANATNSQDDTAVLVAALGSRPDDHGDTNNTATALSGSTTLTGSGVISSVDDRDRFSFTAATGGIQFDAVSRPVPGSVYGQNLDMALELYDAAGNLLATGDDGGSVSQTVSFGVAAGTYYVRVKGVGCGTPYGVPPSGYTPYGSLGGYSLTGTFTAGVAPSITQHPSGSTVTAGQTAGFYSYGSGNPAPTYQWQRFPVGGSAWVNVADGSGYSGATTYSLSVSATTLAMNGDLFRLVATNLSGSATSNAATLTVNTPTPPSIYSGPWSTSTTVGTGVYFSVSVSGSSPFTYIWQRQAAGSGPWSNLSNDSTYSGVTSSYLSINNPTLAMNGDKYRVTVSNGGGSVDSSAATLTVNAVVAPTISGLATATAVAYGNSLSLYPSINGTYPIACQWYFNNTPIANANSQYFSISNVKAAQAGTYTLKATNSAGTATASTEVTVDALIPVTITQHPAAQDLVKGNTAYFSVQTSGSQPLTYQWYRDGNPVNGATSSYLYVNQVSAALAGNYTVTVTNDAGSVTSAPALLNVLPAEPPRITEFYFPSTISSSNSLSLSASVYGTGPLSYQWYKDGVAIPGATGSSYYVSANVTPAMAGNYSLRVSNEAGTAFSPDGWVAWSAGNTLPWLGVARQGDVVYFLFTSPGRILRYDLAQEAWLPVVYMPETKVPTAFLPTDEGVFIAYGKELVRRNLALTPASEVAVATSTNPINLLFAADSYVFFRNNDDYSNNVRSFHRQTLAAGALSSTNYADFTGVKGNNRAAYASQSGRLMLAMSSGMELYSVNGSTLVRQNSVAINDWFRTGAPIILSPNQSLLAVAGGTMVSTSTMDYAAAVGRGFDDVVFLDDTSLVALRGRRLTEHAGTGWIPVGELPLTSDGLNLFKRGEKLFVFGAPAPGSGSNPPVVQKATTSAFNELPVTSAATPIGRKVSLDDMFMGANGALHIVSRSERGVLRWDPATRQFLATLPLRGRPVRASYAPAIDRLVLGYADGALSDLFLSSNPAEELFGNLPAENSLMGMATMDDLSAVHLRRTSYSSSEMRLVIGAGGEVKHFPKSSYYYSSSSNSSLFWQPSQRRLYTVGYSYDNQMAYYNVATSGVIADSYGATVSNVTGPVRPNPEGTLLLSTNGRVFVADLQHAATLPNPVADGAWQPNSLFTIRVRPSGTQVQKWARITYEPEGTLTLPGIPQRIFRIDDDSLLVVTTVDGYLVFNVVSNALEVQATVTNDTSYIPARPALFSATAYLAINADVATDIGDVPDKAQKAWEHYWKYGAAEGRTDGDFSVQAYLAQYPDLAATFGADVRAAALHWYTTGRKDGRRVPAGFDVNGYFARNQDIAAYYVNDKYGAWLHYYGYGVFEGRSFDTNFIPAEYLELNADLKAALGADLQGAAMHWLTYGHPVEDRMGRVPVGFNIENYFTRYPDLEAAFANVTPIAVRNVAVWNHYVAYGVLEGRSDGDFEANNYLATNADLAAVFGTDIRGAALHWYFYGRREGRRIPPGFDVHNYRALYPDLEVFTGDDLYGCWLHYRDVGVNEGRYFNNLFRPADYLALNPDVAAAVANSYRDALLHWLYYGQYEGRSGKY